MKQPLPAVFNIYIRLDEQTVHDYFNHHDPAPLYKRQLDHQFEQYIYNYLITSKRDAEFKYQVICVDYADKRFVSPVIQAIRNHFNLKLALKAEEFSKFKRRTFWLLGINMVLVFVFQLLFPFLAESVDERMAGALHNVVDVFSWVILWKPIDRMIYYWNPYKKDMHLLSRLAMAEVRILEKEKIIENGNRKIS